ncbi:MAG: c-type cytochrome [Ginsengibacter sp.]
MKHLKKHWFIFLSGTALFVLISIELFINHTRKINQHHNPDTGKSLIPDTNELSDSPQDSLIRYGKQLILNTSKYLGPNGLVAHITNGLECGNCHLEGGTKLHSNNFLAVSSTYPKFRARSGRVESVEFRVNECLQRSLNGNPIDSLSKEMKAMVAYIKWTGKNVDDKIKDEIRTREVPFLPIAADSAKGAIVYQTKCKLCHGNNGEGLMIKDSFRYVYPPLWGENSYAVSAGMYRITKLASFIKYNMPNGATFEKPQLKDEEAWHVAAYISSKPHPNKVFDYDWPVTSTKPVDYPYGPYSDKFSELQHKYGPFAEIQKAREK